MERAICQSTPNIVQHTTRVRERAGDYGVNRLGEGVYCDDIVQINLLSKAAWMTTWVHNIWTKDKYTFDCYSVNETQKRAYICADKH